MIKLSSPPEPVNLKKENTSQNLTSSLLTYFWETCTWNEPLQKKGLQKAEFEMILSHIESNLEEWQREKLQWQQILQQLSSLLEENLRRITGENDEIVFSFPSE